MICRSAWRSSEWVKIKTVKLPCVCLSTVTFYVAHFQLMTNDFPIARPQTKTVKCIPLLSYFRGVGKFWQCYGNKKVQLSQFGCRPSANSLIDCLQLAGVLLPHHQRNGGGRNSMFWSLLWQEVFCMEILTSFVIDLMGSLSIFFSTC